MLIVLEGFDGTGKTTAAKAIIRQFPGYTYYKPAPSSGPTEKSGEEMVLATMELFERVKNGENIVADRLHMVSEVIYGPVCRERSKIDIEQFCFMWQKLMKLDVVIIYCCPPFDVVYNFLITDQEQQMSGVLANAECLYSKYKDFFSSFRLWFPVWDHDYTRDPQYTELFNFLSFYLGVKSE